MKRLTAAAIAAAALLAVCAQEQTEPQQQEDPVILTTLFSDGTTNTWTQADLVAALQLLNRKYHRDVSTEAGRKAWHGAKRREVVDTNTLEKVTYYEDGTAFTDQARIITPQDSANAYNASLPKPVMTNGVPTRLAAARLRQRENSTTTNEVTVTIQAGGTL